jgi:hypothetical protein
MSLALAPWVSEIWERGRAIGSTYLSLQIFANLARKSARSLHIFTQTAIFSHHLCKIGILLVYISFAQNSP